MTTSSISEIRTLLDRLAARGYVEVTTNEMDALTALLALAERQADAIERQARENTELRETILRMREGPW